MKEARNYSQSVGCAKNLCSATMERDELLSSEDASTPDSLDLLFRHPAEEPGLHDDGLLGKNALAQHLAVTSSGYINDRGLVLNTGILEPGLFRDERPELVKVDSRLVQVGVVGVHVEVPHSHLSEVTRMVFVEVDPVVMLTTSVSATSRMLPVLSDPAVTM